MIYILFAIVVIVTTVLSTDIGLTVVGFGLMAILVRMVKHLSPKVYHRFRYIYYISLAGFALSLIALIGLGSLMWGMLP